MIELIKLNSEVKYSSVYLTEQINIFRREENDRAELAHYTLVSKIEREFDEEIDNNNILVISYTDSMNRQSKCYELNYDQSLQLLMSESKLVRKAVIVKLKELISKNKQLPQSFSEALQLAADQAKQLELQAPKVENYDQFIDSKSLQGFKEVANLLGLGRNKMLSQLRDLKILTSKNIPYQQHLSANRFEVKESTQRGFSVATTYVTPKGIEYIKKKLT